MKRVLPALTAVLLFASPAAAAEHASWSAYMKANRYKCPGPMDTLAKPRKLELAGKKYRHDGSTLTVESPDPDREVVIGVMSAIKDVSEFTRKNVEESLRWFRSNEVEWVVVNGDIAIEELDLEDVIEILGQSGMPTLIVLGNSESRSSFARAYGSRADKYPNLVNGTFVRKIVADDAEFWTLPGYFEKGFVYQGAGCRYESEDIELLESFTPAGEAPVVLISHGPPAGKGKAALDAVTDGSHVGDPQMASLIAGKKIPFGLFGHILESGGRAVKSDMKSPVKPKTKSKTLHLNAGSVAGDPWGMNDGQTSYGMAMIVTIDGGKASYEVKRFESRFE